jgi:O-antigen/teichoic acid export membrane protein
MTLAARVGRAIFWGQAGRLAEAAAFFLFSLILARRLGPASYGTYALGVSFAAACAFLAFLGLGPETLGRFLPQASGDGRVLRELLLRLVAVRGAAVAVIAVLAFALRGPLLAHLHLPAAPAALVLILLLFAARSFLDLLTYFSSGRLRLRRVALAKLLAALIPPLLFVAFAATHGAGVRTAWMAAVAGTLAGIVVLAVPPRTDAGHDSSNPGGVTPRNSHIDRSLPLGPILRFGLFAWASNLFVYILGDNADVLLLGWLLPDRSAIGIYAVGAKIAFSLTTLLLGWSALTSVAAFSEAWQSGGGARIAALVEAQWKLSVLCLAGPLLLVIRYAREIVTLFYAPAYRAAAPVLQILAGLMICAVFAGLTLPTSALYATNHESLACGIVAVAAGTNVISEILLVRRFGILGAALATGGSFLLLALLSAAASRRYIAWRYPAVFVAKVTFSAIFALVPTLWLRAESLSALLASAAIWAAFFLAGLFVTKPLDNADPAALARVDRRLLSLAQIFSPRVSSAAGGLPCRE